jgi:molybdopterin converting factor small subunit
MPVTVHIPTPLRGFTAGHDRLELDGATVGEILQALVGEHQALRRHLLQEDGRPRNFVNIYLNETDIRYLGQSETPGASG